MSTKAFTNVLPTNHTAIGGVTANVAGLLLGLLLLTDASGAWGRDCYC